MKEVFISIAERDKYKNIKTGDVLYNSLYSYPGVPWYRIIYVLSNPVENDKGLSFMYRSNFMQNPNPRMFKLNYAELSTNTGSKTYKAYLNPNKNSIESLSLNRLFFTLDDIHKEVVRMAEVSVKRSLNKRLQFRESTCKEAIEFYTENLAHLLF